MGDRVSKNPVSIPDGVTVNLAVRELTVKGKLGELTMTVHDLVDVAHADGQLTFKPVDSSKSANALAGTNRSLANNIVIGVSQGFEKKLVMKGVGYRAIAKGKQLEVHAGYSHPVTVDMPEGVKVATPAATEIVLSGADKQQVNQVAANVRAVRPPEPYKGKGIRYDNEQISLKEVKKK